MTQLVIDRVTTATGTEALLTHTHHHSYGNRWMVTRSHGRPMVFTSVRVAQLAFSAESHFRSTFSRSEVLTTARYVRRLDNSVTEIATLVAASAAYVDGDATYIDHGQPVNLAYAASAGLIRFRDPETIVRTNFGTEVLKYAIHRLLLSDYASDLGLVQATLNTWSFFRPKLTDLLPAGVGVTRTELINVWEVRVNGASHPGVQTPDGDIKPELFSLIAEL